MPDMQIIYKVQDGYMNLALVVNRQIWKDPISSRSIPREMEIRTCLSDKLGMKKSEIEGGMPAIKEIYHCRGFGNFPGHGTLYRNDRVITSKGDRKLKHYHYFQGDVTPEKLDEALKAYTASERLEIEKGNPENVVEGVRLKDLINV